MRPVCNELTIAPVGRRMSGAETPPACAVEPARCQGRHRSNVRAVERRGVLAVPSSAIRGLSMFGGEVIDSMQHLAASSHAQSVVVTVP